MDYYNNFQYVDRLILQVLLFWYPVNVLDKKHQVHFNNRIHIKRTNNMQKYCLSVVTVIKAILWLVCLLFSNNVISERHITQNLYNKRNQNNTNCDWHVCTLPPFHLFFTQMHTSCCKNNYCWFVFHLCLIMHDHVTCNCMYLPQRYSSICFSCEWLYIFSFACNE